LRRYLDTHGELPVTSLMSLAPLSVRNDDSNGLEGTGINLLRVPLGTDIEDPLRRLRAITKLTGSQEEFEQAVGAKELTDITKHAPAATLALSARLLAGSSISNGHREPLAGCTIMNVPGPAIPLYFDGSRMTYFSAIMPISDGMGLVFSVTSYDGMIFISPTSCREQVPDPEFFAQCIRDCFQEYLALADQSRAKRVISSSPRPRRGRGRRAAAGEGKKARKKAVRRGRGG
jgi:hypothetical protein